ncbi:IS110 family transposase [Streptomyces kunmingensis]|uniref:IS110 family transposase n=1 Tax=Streptomyces kunmingensis TaxID=68225 RepID=UPI002D769EF7|nr:transposase [Streptomyces kunmingensis]
MFTIWVGVDIGKEHHHCVALDARGERRLFRHVSRCADRFRTLLHTSRAARAHVLGPVRSDRIGRQRRRGLRQRQ